MTHACPPGLRGFDLPSPSSSAAVVVSSMRRRRRRRSGAPPSPPHPPSPPRTLPPSARTQTCAPRLGTSARAPQRLARHRRHAELARAVVVFRVADSKDKRKTDSQGKLRFVRANLSVTCARWTVVSSHACRPVPNARQGHQGLIVFEHSIYILQDLPNRNEQRRRHPCTARRFRFERSHANATLHEEKQPVRFLQPSWLLHRVHVHTSM